MTFQWSGHQFVGGVLCLDLANTVIYPDDPDRRYDRLAGPEDLADWMAAAQRFGAWHVTEQQASAKRWTPGADDLRRICALRGAVDSLFRPRGAAPLDADEGRGQVDFAQVIASYHLASGIATVAATPAGFRLAPRPGTNPGDSLFVAVAQTAVVLAFSSQVGRIKACPSCAWLFVDMSRSGRRRWCDMRSCGNRLKARRHYERRRTA